ncbi:MAG: aminotransferase class I/II-fold pyridoxal phosphate-dependent enzyme, partial [Actinomycetota bacterium]|nr:aminotransferase class I/II-fold pyridoxal phosphate-dependent enzyme [Actinomycetota bacterium]
METLAIEANEVIRQRAPLLYDALSALGRELYFPKGILTQAAEAKRAATRYNATIGIATHNGKPLFLQSLRKFFKYLKPEETFPYAPTLGLPELRQLWRKHQLEVNPRLEGKCLSMPVVTSGLTHGLSIFADMFCDAGDVLLLPDMMWGNYRMIFATRRGAELRHYPFFSPEGELNITAFREALFALKDRPKALVLLNFPHNPTGYTPCPGEASALVEALVDAAEAGANIVACVDDAYTGLFYEEDIFNESLFSLLAGAHPRIASIKIDGPTKEDYVWGFRVGFITFSLAESEGREEVYGVLEKKVGGLIRGTISKSSMPAQSLLVHAMKTAGYREEKDEKFVLLKDRYDEVKTVLSGYDYADAFRAYPFNSGYFMCLRLLRTDAELLRRHLLDEYGVGVIAMGDRDIRIAFSCIEKEQIKDLFDILYTGVKDLDKN